MTRTLGTGILENRHAWSLAVALVLLVTISLSVCGLEILFDETRLQEVDAGALQYDTRSVFSTKGTSPLGVSAFVKLLQQNAYNTSRIKRAPITAYDLSSTDMLIILAPDGKKSYSPSEVRAIQDFVRAGGGLFLSCSVPDDQDRKTGGGTSIARAFGVVAPPYGVSFNTFIHSDLPASEKTISSLSDHAITQGVGSFYSGSAYMSVQSSASVLAKTESDSWVHIAKAEELHNGSINYPPGDYQGAFPVLAAMRYGRGRIVFSADVLFLTNYCIKDMDNARLATNIVDWLVYGDGPKAMFTANTRLTEDREEMIAQVGDDVLFDAGSSRVRYGHITQYAWDWNSDGTPDNVVTTPLIQHTFTAPGEHTVTLTATAEDGTTSSLSNNILIVKASTANFTFYPTHPMVNQCVTFDTYHSISHVDPFVNCEWDFNGDGLIDAHGCRASWRFTYAGTVTVNLKVTGVSSHSVSRQETIAITPDLAAKDAAKAFLASASVPLPDGAVYRFGVGVVRNVEYSPNGKYVVIATSLGIELCDANTLKIVKLLSANTQDVRFVSFSPDSTTLAIGYDDRHITLCNIITGRMTSIPQSDSTSVVFSPEGKILLVVSRNGNIDIKDIASDKTLRTLPTNNFATAKSVASSPTGTMIGAVLDSNQLMLWKWAGEDPKLMFTDKSYSYLVLAFSPDEQSLALGCSDGAIRILNIQDHSIQCTMRGHSGPVVSVSFAPDRKHLISASQDGTIRIWDISTRRTIRLLSGFSSPIHTLALSPDGHSLAFGTYDAGVYVLNMNTGTTPMRILLHYEASDAVSFSGNGRYLAVGSRNGAISLWDMQRYQPTRTAVVHEHVVTSVAFSPNGLRIASCSLDRSVKAWYAFGDGHIRTISYDPMAWHADTMGCSVAFSPDGRYFAEEDIGSVLTIYNARTMEVLRNLVAGEFWPLDTELAFSPDSQCIATGTPENTIKIWKVDTGDLVKVLIGNKGQAYSVAFSPDGRFIAAGSSDKTVRLWNVATGQLVHTFLGHTNAVNSVAFSVDGHSIVSGSEDGTMIVWNVASLVTDVQ